MIPNAPLVLSAEEVRLLLSIAYNKLIIRRGAITVRVGRRIRITVGRIAARRGRASRGRSGGRCGRNCAFLRTAAQ